MIKKLLGGLDWTEIKSLPWCFRSRFDSLPPLSWWTAWESVRQMVSSHIDIQRKVSIKQRYKCKHIVKVYTSLVSVWQPRHKGSDVLTISHDVLISLRPHREKTYSSIFANMANYNQNIIASPFSAKKTKCNVHTIDGITWWKKLYLQYKGP